MRGVSWRQGGLSWRLTLSYVLVTLVAAFTVLFVVTLALTIQDLQQNSVPPDQALAKGVTVHPETYLDQPHLDEEALRYWVAIPLFDALSKGQSKPSFVAVLNRNGQLVSATACGTAQLFATGQQNCSAMASSRVSSTLALPEARTTIAAALKSGEQSSESTSRLSTGDTLAVQPVIGNRKQVVGALVAVVPDTLPVGGQTGNTLLVFLADMWNHVPAEGFLFVLLAIMLGTITGLLISRNLARRLRQIMQAATVWSRGEFQTTLRDTSSDEVGQLARNLNGMAAQLQLLLTSWQKLAVVEERNRLARELHDSVKQQVFTNALLVQAARKVLARDPQKAQQHLLDAEELAEQTQQELIDLIHALRPAALADKGLAPVMQDYLAAWSRRTGIAFDLHIQEMHPVQPAIESTLFRVFQEALTNVARHSKAKRIDVALMHIDGFLCLTVRDDGIGFDVAQSTEKGIGLTSMRERVEMLAGKLTISSSAQGTLTKAWIPLHQDKEIHEMVEVKDA